jgi:hypothetical protein
MASVVSGSGSILFSYSRDADRLPSRFERVAKLTGSQNHLKPSDQTLGEARWRGGVLVQRHGYAEERSIALGYIRGSIRSLAPPV